MNLKNNKGFAGIDISISLIILIIFIPTIFGIIYNIHRTNDSVKRESKAISIATDILENAKLLGSKNVKLEEEEGSLGKALKIKNYTITGNDVISSTGSIKTRHYSYSGDEDEHYKITITLEYPNNEENDLVKKIKVTVEYPIGNTTKTVEISTVLKSA